MTAAIAGCGDTSGGGADVVSSPPSATAHTHDKKTLLAVGSSCWTGNGVATCASSLPASARTDLPVLRIRSGDEIRFAFQFEPKKVLVELQREDDSRLLVNEVPAHTSPRWAVPIETSEAAFIVVHTKAAPGDVAYLARVESG